MVLQKEKQDKEITNESSTATAIDITAAEPQDEIVINNNFTTSIPTTISKCDAEKIKISTPEKEKDR